MNFPEPSYTFVLIISAILVFSFSFFFLLKYLKFLYRKHVLHTDPEPFTIDRRNDPSGKSTVPIIFITFIVGLAHFCAFTSKISGDLTFRHVKPEQVKMIEIRRLYSEGAVDAGRVERITDRDAIVKGLKMLGKVNNYDRKNEGFSDGYLLNLVMDGQDNHESYFVSVFKKSSSLSSGSRNVTVIIPGISADSGEEMAIGEFSCPEFVKWVNENVDPFFEIDKNK